MGPEDKGEPRGKGAGGPELRFELGTGVRRGDDRFLAGVVETSPVAGSALSLTMICSPLFRPRLAIGSSGMRVSVRGGYPYFTVVGCEHIDVARGAHAYSFDGMVGCQ